MRRRAEQSNGKVSGSMGESIPKVRLAIAQLLALEIDLQIRSERLEAGALLTREAAGSRVAAVAPAGGASDARDAPRGQLRELKGRVEEARHHLRRDVGHVREPIGCDGLEHVEHALPV